MAATLPGSVKKANRAEARFVWIQLFRLPAYFAGALVGAVGVEGVEGVSSFLQPTTTAATMANMATTENSFFIPAQHQGSAGGSQALFPEVSGRE